MSRDNLELQTVFGKNSCEESSVCQTISCTDITIRLLFCVVILRHIHLHGYPLTLLGKGWSPGGLSSTCGISYGKLGKLGKGSGHSPGAKV